MCWATYHQTWASRVHMKIPDWRVRQVAILFGTVGTSLHCAIDRVQAFSARPLLYVVRVQIFPSRPLLQITRSICFLGCLSSFEGRGLFDLSLLCFDKHVWQKQRGIHGVQLKLKRAGSATILLQNRCKVRCFKREPWGRCISWLMFWCCAGKLYAVSVSVVVEWGVISVELV